MVGAMAPAPLTAPQGTGSHAGRRDDTAGWAAAAAAAEGWPSAGRREDPGWAAAAAEGWGGPTAADGPCRCPSLAHTPPCKEK